MSSGNEQPASRVRPVAEALLAAIAPACVCAEIAGSLRRGRDTVGDIEIVAVPVVGVDIFGEPSAEYPALDSALAGLVRDGTIAYDTTVKRNGSKYKRFIVLALNRFVFELFLADRGNYGNILTIRTGPSDYSKYLVTPKPWGAMPAGLRQDGGYLWLGERRVECPTEEDFYCTLGAPWLTPAEREAWRP